MKGGEAMPNHIQDKEIQKAVKLAGRKSGVTRQQLADALEVPLSRATTILANCDAGGQVRAEPLGQAGGHSCRTLVYRIV